MINLQPALAKQVLEPGQGDSPQLGLEAQIFFTASAQEGGPIVDDSGDNQQFPLIFTIGDNDQVVPGLHQAVLTMTRGEKSVFKMGAELASNHLRGLGKKDLPQGCDLLYTVTLKDFHERIWSLSEAEAHEKAQAAKAQGDALFRTGDYESALKQYQRGQSYLSVSFTAQSDLMKRRLNMNQSACWMKLRQYRKVIEVTEPVIEKDPEHVKTQFRRGVSFTHLGQFDKAQKALQLAQQTDPGCEQVQQALRENERARRREQKQRARVLGGMLGGLDYS